MDALTLNDLTFTYPACAAPAIKNIDLRVKEGEFVLLCGNTGCGKTTLLRLIKSSLSPHGERGGSIAVFGKDPYSLSALEEAALIGMVMQRPETQIVSESVTDELCFGMASLGTAPDEIHRRAAEVSGYFGIDHWAEKPTDSLSGGQKQILNLASVIAMRPSLLLLDEPTSRLDPISAAEFIAAVVRLNRETGITVIMAEHRLELALPVCDRVVFMRGGAVEADAPSGEAANILASGKESFGFLPPAAKMFAHCGFKELPLTVKAARALTANLRAENPRAEEKHAEGEPVLSAKNLYFRYEKNSPDVLKGASLEIKAGEITVIMGGNAAGKTTLAKCVCGLLRPYDGKITVFGRNIRSYAKEELYGKLISYLPQDVNAMFSAPTVAEELALSGISRGDIPYGLEKYSATHPYDLSGGEQQKCALAKLFARPAAIMVLDEPTKGLDPSAVEELANKLRSLAASGTAVICVTHDAEFASNIADSAVMTFDGACCEKISPAQFFCGNTFYTTAAAAVARGRAEGVYRSDQFESLLGGLA
ncbi:MAG: energy-coupling factor ABC transporter ATP-binding protein [Clostridia bacterium]|nr:energy-coupling factor ABC transporter ATP-binding protein [Clostridia bacterium]